MTSPIRLFIVDDDQRVRDGFLAYFSYVEDITVVGTAKDGAEALDTLRQISVDVVLSDINMPRMGGIELLGEVKKFPQPPTFVAITSLDTDDSMLRMIGGGAAGYVVKSEAPAKIIDAVRDAFNGGTTVSPEALSRLVDYVPPVDPRSDETIRRIESLSPAERTILDLLCQGHSNSEIARRSFYAESTVKKHVSHLISYFEASSRLELVVQVLESRGSRTRR